MQVFFDGQYSGGLGGEAGDDSFAAAAQAARPRSSRRGRISGLVAAGAGRQDGICYMREFEMFMYAYYDESYFLEKPQIKHISTSS